MQNQLAIKGNYDIAAPGQMAAMAKVLQAHIGAHGLSTLIVGRQYTNVEGWQFAGGLMGYLPKVVKVENISVGNEKKWRADVELIRIKDDKVMGTGSAICSNAENKKKAFDEYAIMSMAQTRAIGNLSLPVRCSNIIWATGIPGVVTHHLPRQHAAHTDFIKNAPTEMDQAFLRDAQSGGKFLATFHYLFIKSFISHGHESQIDQRPTEERSHRDLV